MHTPVPRVLPLILLALITCPTSAADPSLADLRAQLVDRTATARTAGLFRFLRTIPAQGVLIGQQDAFTNHYGKGGKDRSTDTADMQRTYGKDPQVLGLDLMYLTDQRNTPGSYFAKKEAQFIAQVRGAFRKGIITVVTWHVRNPYTHDWFAVRKDPDQLAIAAKSMASILEGGENHAHYCALLDKVATVFAQLTDDAGEPIPVIFRPFHEMDGDWFWWGAPFCTSEQYIANWRFTVGYLRDRKNLHHLLYAFSPDNRFTTEAEYLARHPGDAFADVVGMDNYSDFESGKPADAAAKLRVIARYAHEHRKIAALTEVGFRKKDKPAALFTGVYLPALPLGANGISYVMFWSHGPSTWFVPPSDDPLAADFRAFVDHPATLFAGEVLDPFAVPKP